MSSLGVLNRPVQRGSCYWPRSAPAEPRMASWKRWRGLHQPLWLRCSRCEQLWCFAVRFQDFCGFWSDFYWLTDLQFVCVNSDLIRAAQALTLQYIILYCSTAQQPGSRSGKWLKVSPKIRLISGVNPHIWKSWKMCVCMPFQPCLSFLLFFWSE